MKKILTIGLALLLTGSAFAQDNKLTKAEKKEGFKLLFDGKSTKGWHNFQGTGVKPNWVVQDGTLHLTGKGGGDIVTDEQYENFELRLDWKISEGGNSGIFYLASEDPKYSSIWKTAPEMQVLDDDKHPDGKLLSHRAGSLYDLIASYPGLVKPVGEWNSVRVILNKGNLQHWINGTQVVNTQMGTDDWKHMVASSKFASAPDFGTMTRGAIGLQDHGDKVWFKNIRIRKL